MGVHWVSQVYLWDCQHLYAQNWVFIWSFLSGCGKIIEMASCIMMDLCPVWLHLIWSNFLTSNMHPQPVVMDSPFWGSVWLPSHCLCHSLTWIYKFFSPKEFDNLVTHIWYVVSVPSCRGGNYVEEVKVPRFSVQVCHYNLHVWCRHPLQMLTHVSRKLVFSLLCSTLKLIVGWQVCFFCSHLNDCHEATKFFFSEFKSLSHYLWLSIIQAWMAYFCWTIYIHVSTYNHHMGGYMTHEVWYN